MTPRTVYASLIVGTALLILSGCSKGVNGETVMGSPGSPMWHSTASLETQLQYFRSNCLGYGYKLGTPQMAQCLQTEMQNSKSRAVSKMNNINTVNAINNSHISKPITCNTIGSITTCN